MKLFIAILLLSSLSALAQTTRTVCSSGCDHTTVQAAIDAASRGDTIVITAGQTFTENVILKYKASGSGYVIIQSSALASLPTAGNRVAPADASNMPLIRASGSGSSVTISTEVSGGNPTGFYKLIGLNIERSNSSGQQTTVIALGQAGGTGQDSLTEVPHDIIIDRCLIRGSDSNATRRGIGLNAKDVQIINSYIDNFWESGADSQAIGGWNGVGGYLIANNFLEGASENILFGGADPAITDLVPTDITIEHNHFFKRLAWEVDGTKQVKNIFETKNARQVVIRNNIFENNWAEGQDGKGVHFSLRNQDGTAPWSVVEDITFEYNIIKNVGNCISFLLEDDAQTSGVMANVTIQHNLCLIEGEDVGSTGYALLPTAGGSQVADNFTIDHNTFIHTNAGTGGGNRLMDFQTMSDGMSDFTFTNNIVAGDGGDIGRIARDGSSGEAALQAAVTTYSFLNNVIQRSSTGMPASNFYAASTAAIGFENYAGADYSLDAASDYKNDATDGTDPGVNWSQLQSRTANVVAGTGWSQSGGNILPVRISSGIRLRGVRL